MTIRSSWWGQGLVALLISWQPQCVGSFSVSPLVCPTGSRHVSLFALSALGDDKDTLSENARSRKAKRKRRFAQTVHPASELAGGSGVRERKSAIENGDRRKRTTGSFGKGPPLRDDGDFVSNRRQRRDEMAKSGIFASTDSEQTSFRDEKKNFYTAWTQRRGRGPNAPTPPNSRAPEASGSGGKSIEDLERIMEQRWGTRLDRWTANDGDAENHEMYEKHRRQGKSSSRTSHDEGAIFRAKPVLDPWQDNTDLRDPLLSRARRNQDRIRHPHQNSGQELQDSDIVEGDDNEDPSFLWDASTMGDFYDEDDEGYEVTNAGSLISPKPLGGSGHSLDRKRSDSNNANPQPHADSHNAETDSAYIFKKPSREVQNRGEKPRQQKQQQQQRHQREERAPFTDKRKKREAEMLPPLLDEDGNEMFLTLEWAEKNVQQYLSSKQANDEGGSFSGDSFDEFVKEAGPKDNLSWEDIGISHPVLLRTLRNKMACPGPLSVQEKTCPPCLSGSDVLVSTHTGSGKTLAFLAPLAQRSLYEAESKESNNGNNSGVKVIVVAPGRELASQIVAVARELVEGTGLKVSLAIGGTPFARNVETLRKSKPAILVGTPGRIAELVVGQPGEKSGRLKVAGVQTLVLDEFDALLQYKPHQEPTNAIVRELQRRHGSSLQMILCSATASDLMGKEILNALLRPNYVNAGVDQSDVLITGVGEPGASTTRVSRTAIHGVVHVPHQRLTLETLRRVLHTEPIPQQVLIFVNDARRVGIVVDKLAETGIVAAPLHGGSRSDKVDRAEVSKALREGYVGIVVATEMAARGIDAPLLTHVINLDLPTDASHYAHRAGRCGRGGRPGVVINFTDSMQRSVPKKFGELLGITMYTAEARGGRLRIVNDRRGNPDNSRR